MRKILLNGDCSLYAYKMGQAPNSPKDIKGDAIPSKIPGNVEIDLMNANLLEDIYKGSNVEKTKDFELYDWWYVKEFEIDKIDDQEDAFIVFDGVDTYAEYFLNGIKIGESDNMLIAHEFNINGFIKEGKNQLAVHIFSSIIKSEEFEVSPNLIAEWQCFENLRCRKSAHSYGWDIFPRVVSAGIWRGVRIEFRQKFRIENIYLSTVFAKEDLAVIAFFYELKMPTEDYCKYTIEILGDCKGNTFSYSCPITYKANTKYPYVRNPVFWWPNGMGEPNLYNVKVRIYDDKRNILAEKELFFGIRHVRLLREDFCGENGFRLYVNNQPTFCKGANWVPLDVLHSKDAEKYQECVLNYVENNSNMVRVWGGGVYEDEEFFDLCDRYGIMVWQDMMLSCHAYPQDSEFTEKFSKEVESFIKRVRNHPSIVLYCGSNETDWPYYCTGQNPNDDILTRKIIPDAIKKLDPHRVYYPTTPLFTEEYVKKMGGKFLIDFNEIEKSRADLPEEHYWWHRDDYKTYSKIKHCFVGEIGYSGCLSLDSMKECMDISSLKKENEYLGEAWKYHNYSTDGDIRHASKYYFGELPENIEDFVLSSQILQAEAYKYLIEQTRIKKPYMTGILLWNMRDGWPAYNSSLVDYYGRKKLSYYFVRQSQQQLVLVLGDDLTAYVCNDSLRAFKGEYKIYDGNKKLLKEGEFSVSANENSQIGKFTEFKDQKYFILELKVGEDSYINHFINEEGVHNFEEYKRFLSIYKELLPNFKI